MQAGVWNKDWGQNVLLCLIMQQFSPYTGVVCNYVEGKTGPADVFVCEQQPTYLQYVHVELVLFQRLMIYLL